MTTIGNAILLLAAAAAGGFAQQWEFGAAAAGSVSSGIPVTSTIPAGTATTGFAPGMGFSLFFAQNEFRHLGGELRYSYLTGDPRIQSGGSSFEFSGLTHVVHYDLVVHTARESRAQFFAAFGGGVKVFQGTGAPASSQPLMQYAYLTRTRQLEPMASVGGGVKFAVARKVMLRAEVRDYISPLPTQVVAPALGATFGRSWVHNLVPMVGFGFAF